VGPDEHRRAVPELAAQQRQVERQRVLERVPPRGDVEHGLRVLGQLERRPHAGPDRVAVGPPERVVAGIARLEDLALEAEGAASTSVLNGLGDSSTSHLATSRPSSVA
jgi:hypothetical protein